MTEHSEVNLHGKNKNFRQAYVEYQLTQHEFHTERQETNHSLDTYSTTNSLRNSRDMAITSIIEFHINNPIRELLHEFRQMLKEKGFKCIQIFQNQMYLVRMTTFDKIKKLFACIQPPKYMLSIRTHEYRSVRTVSIKPVQAPSLSAISTSTIAEAESILQYLQSSKTLNKPLTNEQMNELDSEYKQDIYSLDATSDYMFSRMLVDTNYSIGKRISMIINQFRQKKSLEDIKFAQLVWINNAISQVTQDMLEGFNCSRKELYEILGYCRKSIENYFYSSIQQYHAQNTLLSQRKSFIPQKDIPEPLHQQSIKNESFFLTLYPVSIKHLKTLLRITISVEIYEQLFLLSEFIKIETQTNKVSEELKIDFLTWIKEEFGQKILTKLKSLRAAGFVDKTFENFIKELRFQE